MSKRPDDKDLQAKQTLADSIYNDGAKDESLKLTAEDLTALFEPL